MSKRTGGYVQAQAVPEELWRRWRMIQMVGVGQMTVTQAARILGLSRVQMQSLVHRTEAGAVEALRPKRAGRPQRPAAEQVRERELRRLRRENEKLQAKLGKMEHVLLTAAELMQGRILESRRVWARERGRKPAATGGPASESTEPDGAESILASAWSMREMGLEYRLVVALTGVCASTLCRWARRQRQGQALRGRRGPSRAALPATATDHAARVVRKLHGLVGADALRVQTGLSRRQAATVKQQTLTTMERERKASCCRVTVSEPGILRGFDQMYVPTDEGFRYPLIAADGAVPFRTSVLVAEHYDEDSVAAALLADMRAWGAPLVYRLDRFSGHRTPLINHILDLHGVLALHGPPHHPHYYGQLERQNLEHRAYIEAEHPRPDARRLPSVCAEMREALNTIWPRRALGWRTAAQAWRQRRCITASERTDFRGEVYDRRARLERDHHMNEDLATRLAIEQALSQRGYLRVERPFGAN